MTRGPGGTPRERRRRLGFGLATLLGLKPLGFFVPYRYAAGARAEGYPALEPLFRAAEPAFRAVLDAIEAREERARARG